MWICQYCFSQLAIKDPFWIDSSNSFFSSAGGCKLLLLYKFRSLKISCWMRSVCPPRWVAGPLMSSCSSFYVSSSIISTNTIEGGRIMMLEESFGIWRFRGYDWECMLFSSGYRAFILWGWSPSLISDSTERIGMRLILSSTSKGCLSRFSMAGRGLAFCSISEQLYDLFSNHGP